MIRQSPGDVITFFNTKKVIKFLPHYGKIAKLPVKYSLSMQQLDGHELRKKAKFVSRQNIFKLFFYEIRYLKVLTTLCLNNNVIFNTSMMIFL